MWFICALLTAFGWGIADIFYKKGADQNTNYTHLRTCLCVGIVMGIHAVYILITKNINYNLINILYYFPVSLMYILSMILTFYGLRVIEDSIASPVENSSGAITAILCFLILGQTMSKLSLIGVVFVTLGVILLGIFEASDDNKKNEKFSKKTVIIGFLMPVMYSIFNAIGGLLDATFLDIKLTPLKYVTEDTIELVANTSYELTFAIFAILIFIFLKIKKEKVSIKEEKIRIGAAIFETIGQLTYVYAMSGNAIIAAPIVSSVCVISVILARIFLKEKLKLKQYGAVLSVIIGIFILAFAEVL
jgi:drug/metabolite transporter (DMT)-like permease